MQRHPCQATPLKFSIAEAVGHVAVRVRAKRTPAQVDGAEMLVAERPASLSSILATFRPGSKITLTWVSPSGRHITSNLQLIAGPPQ